MFTALAAGKKICTSEACRQMFLTESVLQEKSDLLPIKENQKRHLQSRRGSPFFQLGHV